HPPRLSHAWSYHHAPSVPAGRPAAARPVAHPRPAHPCRPARSPGPAAAGAPPVSRAQAELPANAPASDSAATDLAGERRIVVAGAGYAGLHVALRLATKLRDNPRGGTVARRWVTRAR